MRTLEDLQLDFMLESFDKPYPAKLKKVYNNEYQSDFTTDNGDEVSVMFEGHEHIDDYDNMDWQISFERNGSQELTGEGDAMRIFATVIKLIREFVKKEKPVYMNFSAVKDNQNAKTNKLQSRERLYSRLIKRYITGYKVDFETGSRGSTWNFTRENVQEMTTTSGVAGTGDDTDTVIVRRRKKKTPVQIARRLFPKK